MRRSTHRVALPLLAAAVSACSDGVAPTLGNGHELALDFCATDAPVFFAYLNEGDDWTAVASDANDTYRFVATPSVGIAFVRARDTGYETEVIYATTEELSPLAGVACTESGGSRTLHGSVAGVGAGADAWITMAGRTAQVYPPPSDFSFVGLPNGRLDLVANRDAFTVSSVIPDRIIVRRGVNLTTGSTMAPLDFASTEAHAPASGSLTVTGLSGSETASLDVTFSTATVFSHDLHYVPSFTTSPQVIYSVPASLTQDGDYHTLDLYADDGSGAYHGLTQFYRVSGDKAALLGPALETPTFTTLPASVGIGMRMTLPAQPQYDSFVAAYYNQQNSRVIYVTGTAAYFDSPSLWQVDVPDLGSLPGFPAAAALQIGSTVATAVEAYRGDAALYLGGGPLEGETLTYAGRASTASATASATQASVRAAPRRARHGPLARRAAR